jgi:hypothetical protein
MVAREIRLFVLNYFISPATCKFPFHYLFVLEAWSVSDQLIAWGIPSL